jgi:hypothetical protein
MKCDTPTLTKIIDKCFDLSMDGRLTQERRMNILALGKRLRGSLLNLLSAQFSDGTKAVEDANAAIMKINTNLEKEGNTLKDIDSTIVNINSLVKSLDDLIKIAVSFV